MHLKLTVLGISIMYTCMRDTSNIFSIATIITTNLWNNTLCYQSKKIIIKLQKCKNSKESPLSKTAMFPDHPFSWVAKKSFVAWQAPDRTFGVWPMWGIKFCYHIFNQIGLVWCGLVWSGLIWSGLVWTGLVWFDLVWSVLLRAGQVWSGLLWFDLVCSGLIWYGLVSSGLVWFALVCSGQGWSGLIWSGLVWFDLVCSGHGWSGLIWSGLVWAGLVQSGLFWSGLVRFDLVWSDLVCCGVSTPQRRKNYNIQNCTFVFRLWYFDVRQIRSLGRGYQISEEQIVSTSRVIVLFRSVANYLQK